MPVPCISLYPFPSYSTKNIWYKDGFHLKQNSEAAAGGWGTGHLLYTTASTDVGFLGYVCHHTSCHRSYKRWAFRKWAVENYFTCNVYFTRRKEKNSVFSYLRNSIFIARFFWDTMPFLLSVGFSLYNLVFPNNMFSWWLLSHICPNGVIYPAAPEDFAPAICVPDH